MLLPHVRNSHTDTDCVLDKWVFSTEAHPFPVEGGGPSAVAGSQERTTDPALTGIGTAGIGGMERMGPAHRVMDPEGLVAAELGGVAGQKQKVSAKEAAAHEL